MRYSGLLLHQRRRNKERLLDSRQPLRPGDRQKAKPQCGFPSAKTQQDSFSMHFRFFPSDSIGSRFPPAGFPRARLTSSAEFKWAGRPLNQAGEHRLWFFSFCQSHVNSQAKCVVSRACVVRLHWLPGTQVKNATCWRVTPPSSPWANSFLWQYSQLALFSPGWNLIKYFTGWQRCGLRFLSDHSGIMKLESIYTFHFTPSSSQTHTGTVSNYISRQ